MKKLNAIIVEDEIGAANNLEYLINEVAPHIVVQARLASIADVVDWIGKNEQPDLAFFDIQLEDGLSFDIFNKVTVNFPVIFTTAFDEYAIKAFKVNSVDYLLKPVKEEELRGSIEKYESLNPTYIEKGVVEQLLAAVQSGREGLSFLVHFKDKLIPVSSDDIAYFHIDNGLVYGRSHTSQSYLIDYKMEDLEQALPPKQYFRANRQFIINKKAIKDIEFYFNGRLSVNMKTPTPELVLVSKARVPVFKAWMKG